MFKLIAKILDLILWKRVIDDRLERYGRLPERKPTQLEVRVRRCAIRRYQ